MSVLYDYYKNHLCHHGIKGQKWGVRRTPEQLKYDHYSVRSKVNNRLVQFAASNGLLVKELSVHASEQAADRKVSSKDIIDALKKPMYTDDVKVDKKGRKSQRFIGYTATVNVNPDTGVISTVWKTGKRAIRKYTRGD